mmetsp:Transcript_147/g.447  ORF Transcript_147/g.447 Transcript_147/m.447 type:complete len:322 (+) Transcript_147:94-1059(+)
MIRVTRAPAQALVLQRSFARQAKGRTAEKARRVASEPEILTPTASKVAEPIDASMENSGVDPVVEAAERTRQEEMHKGQAQRGKMHEEKRQHERRQILVVGGSGFVGSAVCKEAVKRGFEVASMSRSGRPRRDEPWMNSVEWIKADALKADAFTMSLKTVQSIISCLGAFGSPATMKKVNGDANIQIAKAAAMEGVPRFVYISAHRYKLVEGAGPLHGYFAGKRAAEEEIRKLFPSSSVIIRPAMVYGTRYVGKSTPLPLQFLGAPLEMLTSNRVARGLAQLPLLDLTLSTPRSVGTVASYAVRAALGEETRPILEVDDLV